MEYARCVSTIFSTTQLLSRNRDGWGHVGGPKKLRVAHRRILGDIYPWAGKLREVDIQKTTKFVPYDRLEKRLGQVFGRFFELHASDNELGKGLSQLPRRELAASLATLFVDLNAIHPFREGNGRAIQVVCSALAIQAGYELKWEHIASKKDEFKQACIDDHRRIEPKDAEEPRLFYTSSQTKRNVPGYKITELFDQILVASNDAGLEPVHPRQANSGLPQVLTLAPTG